MGLFKKQKDPVVEMEKDLVHEENGMEHDIQADVDAVMKKYDRESNTKIWEGLPKQVIRYAMALFMIFMVYVSMFSSMDGSVRRCWFLGLILVFVYIMYPIKKGAVTRVNYMPWYDIVLAVLSIGTFGYQIYFLDDLIYKGSRLDTIDIIIGTLAILLLIEACRRVVGIPIIVVVVAFMAYALLGSGMEFKDLIYTLFYTTQGILGTPIQVCSTYIFLFVLFGAFLEATGIAAFFIDLANAIAGSATGGPAKVAVISSALCGSLLGFYALYNRHPAKCFMGDTGSLFLGGAVAALAFAFDMPLVLILVGIIYILETLSDIIQIGYFKLTHGKRFFKMAPLHHHLERCGWSEVKIVTVFVSITAVFCLLAYYGIRGRYL